MTPDQEASERVHDIMRMSGWLNIFRAEEQATFAADLIHRRVQIMGSKSGHVGTVMVSRDPEAVARAMARRLSQVFPVSVLVATVKR